MTKIIISARTLAFVVLGIAAICSCASWLSAQSPPEDRIWALVQGRGISADQPDGPSLKLEGQQLSGSTGCNLFTATITEAGQGVKIENLSLTRKVCATSQNETERAFVRALGETEFIQKEPERLTFLSGKRESLLVWKSADSIESKRKANEAEARRKAAEAERMADREAAAKASPYAKAGSKAEEAEVQRLIARLKAEEERTAVEAKRKAEEAAAEAQRRAEREHRAQAAETTGSSYARAAEAARKTAEAPETLGRAAKAASAKARTRLEVTSPKVMRELPSKAEALPYAVQPVFFGTDRKREKDRGKDNRRLAAFGSDGSGQLTLGQAVVTVPLIGRERGTIPRPDPGDLYNEPEVEDAAKHFTLFDVVVMTEKEFTGAVRRRLENAKTFKEQAFIFVHGYNVSFDDALYRTGQIAYDLGFDGAPFLYTWPSKGETLGYKRDLDRALASRDQLRKYVDMITHQTSVKEINLIAHSMGSWPLLEVLSQIAKDVSAQHGIHINQIILAAPDMDRANFIALTQSIKPLAKNLTLYASSKDWAMLLSGVLSLGEDRVGYVPKTGIPIILPGVESIDVSKVSLDFFSLNHTDFADQRHILYDMGLIFRTGTHPPDIRLPVVYEKVDGPDGLFWRYRR
jgi:esterase/lipase superfamily enzyme